MNLEPERRWANIVLAPFPDRAAGNPASSRGRFPCPGDKLLMPGECTAGKGFKGFRLGIAAAQSKQHLFIMH